MIFLESFFLLSSSSPRKWYLQKNAIIFIYTATKKKHNDECDERNEKEETEKNETEILKKLIK